MCSELSSHTPLFVMLRPLPQLASRNCAALAVSRGNLRAKSAVVRQRGRVVGRPTGLAASLLRCVLQADAAGAHKGAPACPACQRHMQFGWVLHLQTDLSAAMAV